MKKSILFTALLGLLVAASCNRFYKSPDFAERTKDHRTVAVLPYEIVITGRLPKDLTEDDKTKIENAESVAFQKSLTHMVHVVGARGRRELTVTVQPPEKTLQILEENGISIRDSWNADPQKLAALLGVDAVVRGKTIKQRYLSGLESIGVDVAANVLSWFVGIPGFWGVSRTNDVEAMVTIFDAKSGETLFTGRDEVSVDWTRPANEAVEQINRRICRRFPYTEK